MDHHQHDDAGPATSEELSEEASQDSVAAEDQSPEEAAVVDGDSTPVPDPTASAQVPDSADLPEDN